MTRQELARRVTANGYAESEIAVSLIWFRAKFEAAAETALPEILEFFESESVSKPNGSRLNKKLSADRRLMSTRQGYKLKIGSFPEFDEAFGPLLAEPKSATSPLIDKLTEHASKITSDQTRSFVLEAIQCMKSQSYRAAVIMTWCGAVSILQDHVFEHHLEAFNEDAVKNGLLKKAAVTPSDLRDISKESHFIEALGRLSVIDASMKRTLKRCLDRRNDCGHPSDVRLGLAAVADHVECLILNVFERFTPVAE